MYKLNIMDTVIRLRPEELTNSFFEKLKTIASTARRVEIRLDGVDATNNLSEAEIESRIKQLGTGKVVSFSMDELNTYINNIGG